MEPAGGGCGVQPSAVFLMVTLLVTSAATALLCAAIMTDHWEYITWDRGKLEGVFNDVKWNTTKHELEWLLDGQVARIILRPHYSKKKRSYETPRTVDVGLQQPAENVPAVFLVPVHGGIWTLCISLTDEQQVLLGKLGFPQLHCTNYMTPEIQREEGGRQDWQHRMQNLSISCALVCLIILGSSAIVGAFGVAKHQISAVLVTGVMYLLAATFAMFTLTIIHFKRTQSKCPTGDSILGLTLDTGVVASIIAFRRHYDLGEVTKYFGARTYSTGWSLHLGWGGVGMCVLVSFLWILLSKIMRYNPLTAFFNSLTVL